LIIGLAAEQRYGSLTASAIVLPSGLHGRYKPRWVTVDQTAVAAVRAAEGCAVKKAERLDQSATILSLEALVLAVAGLKDEAKQVVQRVEDIASKKYFCPYEVGAAYVSLGDGDMAYRWFRQGVEERADCMAWLGVEPWIEPFRSDPRYASLLREIGLDPRAH
jgi:hypothetical protein